MDKPLRRFKQADVKNHKRKKGCSSYNSGNSNSSSSNSRSSSTSDIQNCVDTIQCQVLDYNRMKELPIPEAQEEFVKTQMQRRVQMQQQHQFIKDRMDLGFSEGSRESTRNIEPGTYSHELNESLVGLAVASQFFSTPRMPGLPQSTAFPSLWSEEPRQPVRQSTCHSNAIQRVATYLAVSVSDLMVPVPPDGFCLSYCFTAARYRKRFMAHRLHSGFRRPEDDRLANMEKRDARAFFQRVLVLLRADGQHIMADRLELDGIDGYPGQDELPWFANAAKCIVHLYSLESEYADLPMITFGCRGPVISIGYESSHFTLLNSASDLHRLHAMVAVNV